MRQWFECFISSHFKIFNPQNMICTQKSPLFFKTIHKSHVSKPSSDFWYQPLRRWRYRTSFWNIVIHRVKSEKFGTCRIKTWPPSNKHTFRSSIFLHIIKLFATICRNDMEYERKSTLSNTGLRMRQYLYVTPCFFSSL